MKLRTWVVVIAALVVGIFAILNWQTFAQPAPLNLLVAQVDAPLGIVMLAVLAGMTVLYMLLLARIELLTLLETGRLNKELERMRKLAESSEESRIQALQQYLDHELSALQRAVTRLNDRLDEKTTDVAEREERGEQPSALRPTLAHKSGLASG